MILPISSWREFYGLRGSITLKNIYILLNLESWKLACVCKIEIPKYFVLGKFLIFGIEIGG